MINVAQAEDCSEMIMGNLPVNSIPAKVLFDTGASHCFISKPFASKYECDYQHLPRSLSIVSLGKQMSANIYVSNVSIMMGDYKFLASPIVLGDPDIDLILEMEECDAPISKRTLAGISLTGRLPIITSDESSA